MASAALAVVVIVLIAYPSFLVDDSRLNRPGFAGGIHSLSKRRTSRAAKARTNNGPILPARRLTNCRASSTANRAANDRTRTSTSLSRGGGSNGASRSAPYDGPRITSDLLPDNRTSSSTKTSA